MSILHGVIFPIEMNFPCQKHLHYTDIVYLHPSSRPMKILTKLHDHLLNFKINIAPDDVTGMFFHTWDNISLTELVVLLSSLETVFSSYEETRRESKEHAVFRRPKEIAFDTAVRADSTTVIDGSLYNLTLSSGCSPHLTFKKSIKRRYLLDTGGKQTWKKLHL